MRRTLSSLSHARLKQLLDYDPVVGTFTWRVSRKKCRIGDRAGNLQPNGYRRINIDGVKYYEQRLAIFYLTGAWPPNDVDHAHRTPHLNGSAQLRSATTSQNIANAKRRKDNTAGYKGVSLHRVSGLYRARITCMGKEISLGYFSNAKLAHAAYAKAAKRIFGSFSRAA